MDSKLAFSYSRTSRQAPKTLSDFNAFTNAAVFTTFPRARLIRYIGFMNFEKKV